MLKQKPFIFLLALVLIVGAGAVLLTVQRVHAQATSGQSTIFLPLVTGIDGATENSSLSEGEETEAMDEVLPGDESWESAAPETRIFTAEERKQIDAAPCGPNTIALVHTKQRDQYIFCVNEDGDMSVIELLIDGDEARSRLDKFARPVDLLDAVVPPGQTVPEEVRLSIRNGVALQRPMPYVIGRADQTEPAEVNASAVSATCSTPSLGYSPQQAFFYDHALCGADVIVGSSSYNDTDWHQHTASALTTLDEGSHYHAGPHYPPIYYYADVDEEGDARFGRARVHSCGGTTVLRGWWKASPTTGSWSLVATFNVPAGATATMHVYGNPFQSVWMGYDADDIRFRADAQSGASFGSLFHFFKYAWGPNCQLKY